MTHAVQARVYSGPSQAVSAQQYEADAAEAARQGWVPVSQVWKGTSLTVTYQPQGIEAPLSVEPDEHPSTEASTAEPGIGAYLKAIGLCWVLLIPTTIVLSTVFRSLGIPERLTIVFSDRLVMAFTPAGFIGLFVALAIIIFAVGRWREFKGRKQWLLLLVGTTLPIVLLFVVIPMVLLMAIMSSY